MIVTPLPTPPAGAVRGALLSHGWEGALSLEAAAGLEACAYHLSGLEPGVIERLLGLAPKYGLDLVTGDGWVLLSGTRNRLSAMARSWHLPEELLPVAVEIGRALPADRPQFWRVGDRAVALDAGPVLVGGRDAGPAAVADSEFTVLPVNAPPTSRTLDWPGGGVLLAVTEPAVAWPTLVAALDASAEAGIDPDRIAIDPGWGGAAPSPDLARFRALGRPIACRTDDPVVAVLARARGAQLFRTSRPEDILHALATADRLDP